jgi:hypothetical protein
MHAAATADAAACLRGVRLLVGRRDGADQLHNLQVLQLQQRTPLLPLLLLVPGAVSRQKQLQMLVQPLLMALDWAVLLLLLLQLLALTIALEPGLLLVWRCRTFAPAETLVPTAAAWSASDGKNDAHYIEQKSSTGPSGSSKTLGQARDWRACD